MTGSDRRSDRSARLLEPPLEEFLAAWSRASNHLLNSAVEVNRATFAFFGIDPDGESEEASDSVVSSAASWSFERSVDAADEIDVGDWVEFSKPIEDADVAAFAAASGDTNRLHLDEAFAARTRFGERIVHGTLVSGLISAALARLPGLTIYLSQDVKFLRPVSVGERLTARVEITERLGDDRYRLSTDVFTDEHTVVEGEAVVLVDPTPTADDSSIGGDERA